MAGSCCWRGCRGHQDLLSSLLLAPLYSRMAVTPLFVFCGAPDRGDCPGRACRFTCWVPRSSSVKPGTCHLSGLQFCAGTPGAADIFFTVTPHPHLSLRGARIVASPYRTGDDSQEGLSPGFFLASDWGQAWYCLPLRSVYPKENLGNWEFASVSY